jgi:DNA invertase Pin-like site-specific DNA recombinase
MLADAYSYLRFSSPQQSAGDSIRRQTEAREDWLAAHPDVRLDQSLVMTDAGRSAFRREGWDTYALARFVDCIKAGRVRPGSYLLVENLDRLSREEAGEATELFLSIVNKGVVIVQLSPMVMEFRKPVGTMALMYAIMELSRGHSESAMKSDRSGKAWANKRKLAAKRENVTRKLPGWVRYDEAAGKRVLIPGRVATLRRLFEMARAGSGVAAIALRMNEEKVPLLGRTTFKGKPVAWSESIVHGLLTARTVIGEYQPCKGRGSKREPAGDPVRGYYPAAVDEDLFHAVQAVLKARATSARGRRGKHVNLFAGLLVDARDGDSLTYKHLAKRPSTLIPVGAKKGKGTPWTSFPAGVFEAEVMSKLAEVKASDVWSNGDTVHKTEALAGRYAEVEKLIKLWTAKMDDPALVDVVAAKLAELNGRRKALAEELAEAQREAASPLSESWGEFRSLAELLANDRSDELRERVRSALRRCVESIRCLFVSGRGQGDRFAAVQIHFHRSKYPPRRYVVWYRPPRSNGKARVEGHGEVVSFARVLKRDDIDLRDPADVRLVEEALANLEVGDLPTSPGRGGTA